MKSIIEKIDMFLLDEEENKIDEGSDAYEKFFKEKLKEWDIRSPKELSDRDRKKFFKEVSDEWKRK